MGRPKKQIELALVEDMAAEFCTQEEIASDLGFSTDLFLTRPDVRAAYDAGMRSARISLRHFQFLQAKNGDKAMLIWLGKQYLGQREPVPTPKEAGQDMKVEIIDDV